MTTATTTLPLDEREATRPRQFWHRRPNHAQLWSFRHDSWKPILVQGTRTRRRSNLAFTHHNTRRRALAVAR